MRKNKLMRLASLLLVLVLLTSSVISGTLAKYVMNASGSDSARVARFGVEISAVNDLFGNSYKDVETGNTPQKWELTKATVSSQTNGDGKHDLVVAPGTNNGVGETISVKGTAEVSTKLTFAATQDNSMPNTLMPSFNPETDTAAMVKDALGLSDIYLGNGVWFMFHPIEGTPARLNRQIFKMTDNGFVQCSEDEAVDANATCCRLDPVISDANTEDGSVYKPLVWTVTDQSGNKQEELSLTGETGSVEKALTDIFGGNQTKKPNEAWNLSATVQWEWPFEHTAEVVDETGALPEDVKAYIEAAAAAQFDRLDTILGCLMAWTQDPNLEGVDSEGTPIEFDSVPVIGYLKDSSGIGFDESTGELIIPTVQRVHVGPLYFDSSNGQQAGYGAWVGSDPANWSMKADNVVAQLSASFAYTLTCEQVD